MKPLILYFVFLFIFPLSTWAQQVMLIKVEGEINPITARFVKESIEQATEKKAACLLIELNTPGGLLSSTRNIVRQILSSPIPIVVYVSPAGAHAGSAGVFITLSAHLAAMSPGTNIGAAHPVSLFGQSDSTRNVKASNDAAAFIRSIAEKRKRNVQWAEQAVKNSLSITENQALREHVIDLIAQNEQDLLEQIDGRIITLPTGQVRLQTKNAERVYRVMSPFENILNMLSNPNIAYLFLLIGLLGILFEFFNPGAMVPGVVGIICLVLAFFAMEALPIDFAGLALILFGLVLFVLEIKIVSHGFLAIGGIISLAVGSMMLFPSSSSLDLIQLSTGIVVSATALTTLLFLFAIGMGIKAQRLKPATGATLLVGRIGETFEELNPWGQVQVNGEVWNGKAINEKIKKGETIKVIAVKGLTLWVEKVNNRV